MAFYDHTYASYPFPLSSYAKNLNSTNQKSYMNKLIILSEDGKGFFISDPYFEKNKDWKIDTESYPHVKNSDIEIYLNSTPGKNHRSRSAYEYVVSGKVHDVRLFTPSGHPEYVVITASVQPSQRCNSEPHKPWITCKDNGEVKTAHCTCIAGFGEVCSHVFAVLYRVQLAVAVRLNEVPTEKRCQWNNSFSGKVPSSTLKDVSLEKTNWSNRTPVKRRKIEVTSPSKVAPITREQFALLRKIAPNAVFFDLYDDPSDTDTASEGDDDDDDDDDDDIPLTIAEITSKCEIDSIKSLLPFFNSENLKNLEMKTRSQNNDLWHDHRCGRLTSSHFGEILRRKTVSPAFLKKFITIPPEIHAPSVRWGRSNEVKGFQSYLNSERSKHTNFTLRKAGLFISLTDPYLGCSPDGFINCDCCGSGVLEIKCPYKYKNTDPRNIAAMDSKFCLNIQGFLKEDHTYYAQVQGQMAITNTEYCDFVIWTKNDLLTIRIRRDRHFWASNKTILESFFFNEVIPQLQTKKKTEEHTSIKNMGATGSGCEYP